MLNFQTIQLGKNKPIHVRKPCNIEFNTCVSPCKPNLEVVHEIIVKWADEYLILSSASFGKHSRY